MPADRRARWVHAEFVRVVGLHEFVAFFMAKFGMQARAEQRWKNP